MLEEQDSKEEIPLATLKHVFGGECSGLPSEERKANLAKIAEALKKARDTMKSKYHGTCACHATIARAYAGAVTAMKGEEMDEGKWLALQRFGAGVLPQWVARSEKDKKAAKEIICDIIRQVQGYMHEMLEAWRARAQGGIAFQQRRRTKAGWLWLVLKSWRKVTRKAEERGQDTTSDEQTREDYPPEAEIAANTAGNNTHKANEMGKRKEGTKQGKGKGQGRRGAALYHNCVAIAQWMKLRTKAPEVETPAETERKRQAVNAIAGAWREQIRRRSAPGVGKRRSAGRVARAAAAAHTRVKRFPQNVRNARKLFLGINVWADLEIDR